MHPLPGNVRELENLLHRAVALSDGDELFVDPPLPGSTPEPAPAQPSASPSPSMAATTTDTLERMPSRSAEAPAPYSSHNTLPSDLQAWLDKQERDILVRALRESGFNRTATAARLGISLRQIRYRIERLNISEADGGTESHAEGE
ncbi:helix-turn-helix domain-containing protein [Diaphorobacter aerolatus]|uniref:helix-turn-helix domain-containing protein n=1 Tax=Diaphorobacter aerolatus TaxID=1288495 RepID=UPI00384F13BE